ncbi:MAG TPA: L-seryl-tRNA(Sec) selenium transferase [Actinomycetes bacterium]|jgi:L-seryl-tRNA(Ser) seleniumtransferase|nr:L-seryl-tRNA(Sec) selenium transferase [Actinomycetes bacterium]
MAMSQDPRRAVPKVDALLACPNVAAQQAAWGRTQVVGAVRRVLDEVRAAGAEGILLPSLQELAARVVATLEARARRRLRAVVNATGVVLHTNLGRAPLGAEARAALLEACGPCTVEYDLVAGARGRRGSWAAELLREATGATGALVVNNTAGALLLALAALARGREVVVSRGELIEIGGEFRLPDVMAAAGVTLVEVGTTNRTHLRDYAAALGERSACVLAVHPSNYRVVGFSTRPEVADLAKLAHERGLPLLHDVGSGLIQGSFGEEPSVRASLEAGADVVIFSGDKLVGGPQAGLLVGDAELVERLARHPIARAVRADKLTLAALEATLAAHVAGHRDELPVWRALLATPQQLRPRAMALAAAVGPSACQMDGVSVAGGGSLPGESLPSVLVVVDPGPAGAESVLARLRAHDPPVVARAERGRVLLDLRTVPPERDGTVVDALRHALRAAG